MTDRTSRAHRWEGEPGRLLGLEGPYDLWGKLAWEAGQFTALRASDPPVDIDGMVYLIQSACLSAVAAVEWLRNGRSAAARPRGRAWDADGFERAVARELPDLPLARAVANTLRHGRYRDEGWGDAQIRLEPIFTAAQRERVSAAELRGDFETVFADEAAEARFLIGFTRGREREGVDADAFVADLSNGVLRLLDSFSDGDGRDEEDR